MFIDIYIYMYVYVNIQILLRIAIELEYINSRSYDNYKDNINNDTTLTAATESNNISNKKALSSRGTPGSTLSSPFSKFSFTGTDNIDNLKLFMSPPSTLNAPLSSHRSSSSSSSQLSRISTGSSLIPGGATTTVDVEAADSVDVNVAVKKFLK